MLLGLILLLAACGGGGDASDSGSLESAQSPTTELQSISTEPSPVGGPVEPLSGDLGGEDGDPTDGDPTGPGPGTGDGTAPPAATGGTIDPALLAGDGGDAQINQIVQSMTVEQKVGQVFTVTVIGDDATTVSQSAATSNMSLYGVATPAEVVQRYHLGGVAYFDHDQGPGTSNVADLGRTATLSAGLQRAAMADTGIGLLIGTDQEGGRVTRLRDPSVVFPSARGIAATGRPDLAEQAGTVTAGEALAVGVNWIYAPVADVNINPSNPVIGDRAFGTTADRVIEYVGATAQGLVAGGVLPTLKHFPGHGDTSIDSHNSLPTIDHDRAMLDQVDLPPFRIAQELPVASVMVGHLAVPALDPSGLPATLSPAIINVLRDDLQFDGLVVTDAMNMGALSGFGDSGSLAVQAVNAGIDVVLMPVDLPQAWTTVLTAVQDGTIPASRLDQSVARILRAKSAIGVLDASIVAPGDPTTLGSDADRAVRDQVRSLCGC